MARFNFQKEALPIFSVKGTLTPMTKQQKRALKIIFFTVFLDLVGFGIILPLIPYLARQFSASPLEIGFLMAIFSFMQFVFSPFWGKLSDRYGRRPIILMSIVGAIISYLFFAFSQSLVLLFVARGMAGFFAANISAAQAYIADITTKDQRSVGMGLIGAAFGMGFIMGPAIAGLTGPIGESLGTHPPFGIQFSAVVAAGLNFINLILAFFMLPETLDKTQLKVYKRVGRWESMTYIFKHHLLRSLFTIFLLISLAMALMEVMVFPFVQDRFNWDYKLASISFAYVGVIMVITQGYFIRKWIPKFGEKKTLLFGLAAMGISFLGIGLSYHIYILAIAMTLLAVGSGCMRPPIVGLASVITDDEEQGYVLGVMNSMGAVGRIIGPIVGGWLYQEYSQGMPFFASAILAAVSTFLFILIMKVLPDPQLKKD
jgi:MFS transporter, DHA1 family, tetracycline resistance protein